jgi:hypothetical protein
MKEDVDKEIDCRKIGGYSNRRTWVGYNFLCSISI